VKNYPRILVFTILCLNLVSAHAQFGPAPSGPNLGGPMDKLFGDNQAFSATLEFQTADRSGNTITMPGKISFDAGKSRFEVNMANVQGKQMPPEAAAQMKSMGLDQMVMVARPDKKVAYLIYPGMQSYVETDLAEAESAATNNDYKVETAELGKETVDSHPCVKNKVTVTDKEGNKHESTVWNATDLENFPVKIQTTEAGANATMLFKNVSPAKPAASLFEAPSDYTKYDNMQTMMQQQIMKRMGGGGLPGGIGRPPGK
jgi:hypothetical protein